MAHWPRQTPLTSHPQPPTCHAETPCLTPNSSSLSLHSHLMPWLTHHHRIYVIYHFATPPLFFTSLLVSHSHVNSFIQLITRFLRYPSFSQEIFLFSIIFLLQGLRVVFPFFSNSLVSSPFVIFYTPESLFTVLLFIQFSLFFVL